MEEQKPERSSYFTYPIETEAVCCSQLEPKKPARSVPQSVRSTGQHLEKFGRIAVVEEEDPYRHQLEQSVCLNSAHFGALWRTSTPRCDHR